MKKWLVVLFVVFSGIIILSSCSSIQPEMVTSDAINYTSMNYINNTVDYKIGEKELEIFRVEAPDTGIVKVYF